MSSDVDELVLRLPTEENEHIIWGYRQEFEVLDESADGTAELRSAPSFDAWYRCYLDNSRPETVRPGRVPATELLALRPSDGRLVGMINIRHTLNDFLLNFGGHIGYSVRASERRRGYAREMLRRALVYCQEELGLDRVLVTCDRDNEASRRTILSQGGVLEDERPEDGGVTQRYWIKSRFLTDGKGDETTA